MQNTVRVIADRFNSEGHRNVTRARAACQRGLKRTKQAMRHPRFIVHRAKTKPFIKGPGLRRGMGVEKVEPGAGVGDNRDQQLLADAPATIAFADVEVANAPGPRLRTEGIAIDAAYPYQLVVDEGAQQRFARRVKAVLPLCQFSARRRSILKCCSRLSIRSAANPGASGVVAAINRGGIASSIKSSRDARRAPAGGGFPPPQVRLEPESAELFQDCIK